jgi:hypothetical protein
MLSADLRAGRERVVREHMASENDHDFDTTIATGDDPGEPRAHDRARTGATRVTTS